MSSVKKNLYVLHHEPNHLVINTLESSHFILKVSKKQSHAPSHSLYGASQRCTRSTKTDRDAVPQAAVLTSHAPVHISSSSP